jgi:hypothetical protein
VSGLAAALWLLGLYGAAPVLRTRGRYRFVDRLRDSLILGVAIPFALGFVHALYPPACWVTLAGCVALAARRRVFQPQLRRDAPDTRVPYVLVGALVAVAWPALMRPLLDGDSLSYHLPNAASWIQAHSVWTAATRYWWYPPGSELFASALYAVAGPFALPWSGFGALMLLGFRIVAWAREIAHVPMLLADTLAAATVTALPLAIQAGTLQNDAWLAAFWLEALWAMRAGSNGTTIRTLAMTALIKPQGWVMAVIAALALRAPRKLLCAAMMPLALWVLRDAILWGRALVSPAVTARVNELGSAILAHGIPALVLLARVALHLAPFAFFALCAALLAPVTGRRDARVAWAAFAAALLFLILPFGYETAVAQLATGASLRFAAPAIVVGAAILAPLASRLGLTGAALLAASTLYGVWMVLAIFWNDGSTHVALGVAAFGVAITATAYRARIGWLNAVAFGLAVVAATHAAARHPTDYYADALRSGKSGANLYRWIATTHPAAIGGWGLRLGAVNVLSPATETIDLPDAAPCERARERRVLLVAVAEADRPIRLNAERLGTARRCGRVLYDDANAVVARP